MTRANFRPPSWGRRAAAATTAATALLTAASLRLTCAAALGRRGGGAVAWCGHRQTSGVRVLRVPRRGQEPRFSADKLRAESEDPFSKVRIVFFGFGFISTLIGLLFLLPRLLGSVLGAPNAQPLESVGVNLAINAAGTAFFGFLAFTELESSTKREQQREEGALIARLQVGLRDGGKSTTVKLGDVRSQRRLRARRPVLCIGTEDFCRKCVESSAQQREAVDMADFLLVPVLSASVRDTASLQESAENLDYVAMPSSGWPDWELLCQRQSDQVKSQGLDESNGCVIIVKKNGRVGTRFLGVPDWAAMTGEINARVSAGLDTTNI